MAGTALGHRALPASPLVTARPKRARGRAVNAATRSEADLQLRHIAQLQEVAAVRPSPPSRCCGGSLRAKAVTQCSLPSASGDKLDIT